MAVTSAPPSEVDLERELPQSPRHDHLRQQIVRADAGLFERGRVRVEHVVEVEHRPEARGRGESEHLREPQIELIEALAERRARRDDIDGLRTQRGRPSQGGGDFGSRYAWYVDKVRRVISENWLKYEVDSRITTANRVYLTFDIARDGSPGNVQVEQSSGVPSLDQSAVRAIQRIDTFGPLPPDYSGNKVSVEFWFDYKR